MKLNQLLLVMSVTLLLFSCKTEDEFQGELVNVKLTPAFISLNQNDDVPMSVKGKNAKISADPGQVIYAIQVYENDSAYYYGLFDKVDSMKIALTTGKNYRFKIATYKVGTGSGLKQENQADGKYFYLPNKTLLGNKFIKGNALRSINLVSSIKLNATTTKNYPEIDVFYCEKTVTVEKGLANINFNLLRMGFGVTYNVDGLTNGKLNIIMGNDTTVLNSENSTDTSVRLFNVSTGDLSTIFSNANTYADSILVKVQWVGTNGTTLDTEREFKFTRNYQKTINIQLNTSNLNLNFESWQNIPTDGLIAWYPFSGNANDESGNLNNGTVYGSALTTDRFGNSNNAYYFDGISNYIELPSINLSSFSVSVWIYSEAITDTWQTIISKWKDDNSRSYSFAILNGLFENGISDLENQPNTTFHQFLSASTLKAHQWNHIVSTYNKETGIRKIYINSNLDNTRYDSPINITQTTDKTYIGTLNNISGAILFFNGKIDDVAFYNKELTQQEISTIYNIKY